MKSTVGEIKEPITAKEANRQFDEIAGEIVLYNDFETQLAELEEENKTLVFNVEDPKGNKEARSHIYVLRQTKSRIDTARKGGTEAARKYTKAVNEKGNELIQRVQKMIDHHEGPLNELKEREEERLNALSAKMVELNSYTMLRPEDGTEKLSAAHAKWMTMEIEEPEYQEFTDEAVVTRDKALNYLSETYVAAEQREKEKAELERFREKEAMQAEIQAAIDVLRVKITPSSTSSAARLEIDRLVALEDAFSEVLYGDRIDEARKLLIASQKEAGEAMVAIIERENAEEQRAHEMAAQNAIAKLQNMAMAAETGTVPEIEQKIEHAQAVDAHPDWPTALQQNVLDTKSLVTEKLDRLLRAAIDEVNRKQEEDRVAEVERQAERAKEDTERTKTMIREATRDLFSVIQYQYTDDDGQEAAKAILDAIITGDVRHVKVTF